MNNSTGLTNEMMEEFFDSQFFLPQAGIELKTPEEFVDEVQCAASHYKSPLTIKETLLLKAEKELLPQAFIADEYLVPNSGKFVFPLRWKKIFDYLYWKGVIRRPYPTFDPLFNDEPKIYGLRLWAKLGEDDEKMNYNRGGYSRGVSFDFNEAISKVVGEFLERYPLTLYKEKKLLAASIAHLRRKKVDFFDPFLLDQFSEWQKERFPRFRFSDKSNFRWVEGRSLMTGKKALIPAQIVFWNYHHADKEPIIQQSNTSGAGGMFTRDEAILSGLYELIQRDGFLIYWLNGIPPRRIDINSLKSKEGKRINETCKRYGLEIEIMNATSDLGVPTVVTVLLDRSGKGPAVTLGGGCGMDPESAIMRSYTEALGVRYWLRNRAKEYSFDLDKDYEPFATFGINQLNRLMYWGNPGMHEKISFFLQGKKQDIQEAFPCVPKKKPLPKQELNYLKKIFQKRGKRFEIYYYEAKHEILEKLGYSSVRVAVPAMLPLFLNEVTAPLGNPRIQDACKNLGLEPAEKINPIPHPFP